MSSPRERIRSLAGCFLLLAAALAAYLWVLMVQQHELWSLRSHQNRWAFRAVPGMRGSISDRHGHELAVDEATTRVTIHYARFRLRHPVGAAVHGGTLAARLRDEANAVTFSYQDGELGPRQAAFELLSLPAGYLRRGVLPKGAAGELATTATTLLAACSGRSRREVFANIREAAANAAEQPLAAVLGADGPAPWLPRFAEHWQALQDFAAAVASVQAAAAVAAGPTDLLAELERLREASLLQLRRPRRLQDGSLMLDQEGAPIPGNLIESIVYSLGEQLPFELSARLITGEIQHPGLQVLPSVRRVTAAAAGPSLRALLGQVKDFDKLEHPKAAVADFVANELAAEWLQDLVPEEIVGSAFTAAQLRKEAIASLEYALLTSERLGITGLEAGYEAELGGSMGLRLVERDARRRELQLWGALQVAAGDDLRLTLDLELQQLAERVVAWRRQAVAMAFPDAEDQQQVEVGLCLLDARSGAVLAVAGDPVLGNHPRSVPGVGWRGDGSIGSLAKPFVLCQQLLAERTGQARAWHGEFDPCGGKLLIAGARRGCAVAHGSRGSDPVAALATSCNSFFFQSAAALGADGIRAAMQSFGLRTDHGAVPAVPLTLRGLPFVPWRFVGQQPLPLRSIGYGVEASILELARGYAAIATGSLQQLTLQHGAATAAMPLPFAAEDLAIVRDGLHACVTQGTARDLPLLAELGVAAKTGTAEVGATRKKNNAWFAGYLPVAAAGDLQLAFCCVVYQVPQGVHGGDAAAMAVVELLASLRSNPVLANRYLPAGAGR